MPQDRLAGVFRLENQVPRIFRQWSANRGFDLVNVDAKRRNAPKPRSDVGIARVHRTQLFHQIGIKILQIGDLALVERHQQTAFKLDLGPV